MTTLDEIAIKYGTDKGTTHAVKGHGYAPIYERFFDPLRDKQIKFLEIGVGGGESIRTWLDYFSKARIYGVDIVRDTNIFNVPGKPYDRYTFVHGQQESEVFWKCFLADQGEGWDVIVDDGSHMADGVITSFNMLWPVVKSGGLYCIEDLGVASTPGTVFVPAGCPNHLMWITGRLHAMNRGENDIAEFHYFPELAIFRKK